MPSPNHDDAEACWCSGLWVVNLGCSAGLVLGPYYLDTRTVTTLVTSSLLFLSRIVKGCTVRRRGGAGAR